MPSGLICAVSSAHKRLRTKELLLIVAFFLRQLFNSFLGIALKELLVELFTSPFHTAAGEGAVKYRHEEQREDGGEGEAADDGCTHRLPHFRTLSAAHCHGHHAEDGGERGHNHRTQTRAAAVYYGCADAHAAFAVQRDIVDEHNAVFNHNADEHNGTDKRHHIERVAGNPQYQEDAREGEHQRRHDDAGICEAFELRRHDYVDQDDDEHCG